MELKDYIKIEWNFWILKIRVVPNSRQTCFSDVMSDWTIKIRINSLPEKWKANNELINYLSWVFGVKKSNITITLWLTDKNKLVRIDF